MKNELKDLGILTAILTYWWAILIGLFVAGLFLFAAVQPQLKNQETKAIHQSNQYVISAQEELKVTVGAFGKDTVRLAEMSQADRDANPDLVKALEAQRANAHQSICSTVQKIDKEFWPESVKSHLAQYSCN